MAPKRSRPSEDPPPASSSEETSSSTEDEEEEEKRESGESEAGSGSDTDDEDDKEEQKRPSLPKSSSPPPPPPQQKSQGRSGSKTESDSESETESESESGTRQYTVKPIASRPMEEIQTPPAKKHRPETPSSSKQPSAKRKVEVEEEQPSAKRKVEVEDSKKGKKKDVAENGSVQKPGEESKKPMFHRIWGDSDEVALLQGMIDFRDKKGMDPCANTNTFHHYVKKSLGQEFTASQLANKIRVLKKKYSNNEGKGKDGEDRTFSKPHEQKVFDLSKKIWGVNKSNDASGRGEQTPTPKANDTAKKGRTAGTSSKSKLEASELQVPKENGRLVPFEDTLGMLSCDKILQLSRIGLDEDFLNKGWDMVDESKREEFKRKRRKLQFAEMRVLAERAELIQCQTNLILEAYHQATGK